MAGPLTDFDLHVVGIWGKAKPIRLDEEIAPKDIPPPGLYPAPDEGEVAEYLERHGELRHARTVRALLSSPNGLYRLAPVNPSPSARRRHVEQLQWMRVALAGMIDGTVTSLGKPSTAKAPKYLQTDGELRTFLECSAVRVATDGYVAAIAAGKLVGGNRAAAAHGLQEAQEWLTAWMRRSLT